MTQLQRIDPAPLTTDPGAAFDLFDQAAARFLATKKQRTQQAYEIGLRGYRSACEAANLPPISGDALICYSTLQEALRADQGGDFSNDTIRLRLKAVNAFFRWAWAFDLSPIKPELLKHLITMPPARRLSPRDLLSEDEARALLHAARFYPADVTILTLMLKAGLRLGEVLGLRAGDVYQLGGRCFVKVERGKGDKSREVPIRLETFNVLQDYAAAWPPEALLFPKPEFYPRKIQRLLSKHARRAGISKPISPHSLRHSFANKLREMGVGVDLIAEMLGHTSYDITRRYTRPGELLGRADLPALPW